MNLLLINNHSTRNAGDHVILIETLRILEQAFPAAHMTLSFNDVSSALAALPNTPIHNSLLSWFIQLDAAGEYTLTPRSRRLPSVALALLSALIYRATGILPRLFRSQQKHSLLQAFATADIVLACGGGYLFAPAANEGILGPFTLTLLGAVLALLMGKPLVLLPQSIGPLHDDLQRRLVRWVARRALLTLVRERRSLHLLHELGCSQRALCSPDLAFGFSGSAAPQARILPGQQQLAALQPAFWVGMTAINWQEQNYAFSGQNGYEQALIECIDTITAQGGVVALFPQCSGPGLAEDDRLVSRRLQAGARCPERVMVIDEPLHPDALQAAYGQMDYFIGTRMHSVILALNAGVPTIAIGYLHKTAGMFELLGIADKCYDITTLTGGQLIAAFEQLRLTPTPISVTHYLYHARRAKQALPELIRMAYQKQHSEKHT